ncbi:MAG: hypothetical protein EXQ86_08625 [Rhodospirillales bacterium]|nr:hypothetical protein [Rhodospirillales bacterium]
MIGVQNLFRQTFFIGAAFIVALALGELAVRTIAPQNLSGSWFVIGPRGLVLNKAEGTARHQSGARAVNYRFNRFHQRGGEPVPGMPSVLLLGSSSAFGWLLEEDHAPTGLLQAYADGELGPGRVQFLNAATGGWGTDSFLAYLETFGDRIKPLSVLIVASATDFAWAARDSLYAKNASGALVPRAKSASKFLENNPLHRLPGYEWLLTHSHLAQLARQTAVKTLSVWNALGNPRRQAGADTPQDAVATDGEKAFGRTLLGAIRTWCETRGAALLITTQYHIAYAPDAYRWLEAAAREDGLAFFDASPEIRAAVGADAARYFIETDPHPNERLNELIARVVWRWLKPVLAERIR